jgi:hypothetical protein
MYHGAFGKLQMWCANPCAAHRAWHMLLATLKDGRQRDPDGERLHPLTPRVLDAERLEPTGVMRRKARSSASHPANVRRYSGAVSQQLPEWALSPERSSECVSMT